MTEPDVKLCPFDKKLCIEVRCAVWSDDDRVCALSLIPRLFPRQIIRSADHSNKKEHPVSTGISGKYQDPLFG